MAMLSSFLAQVQCATYSSSTASPEVALVAVREFSGQGDLGREILPRATNSTTFPYISESVKMSRQSMWYKRSSEELFELGCPLRVVVALSSLSPKLVMAPRPPCYLKFNKFWCYKSNL